VRVCDFGSCPVCYNGIVNIGYFPCFSRMGFEMDLLILTEFECFNLWVVFLVG
jgi:hypothetical protein